MKKHKLYRLASLLSLAFLIQFLGFVFVSAQDSAETNADLTVAGIELGNRKSAENFLKDGYAPRLEKDGSVSYYFYNKWANQVMKLSAPSMEDKYFITEIKVFKVNRKYRERHYQAEDIKYFSTKSGIFIGFKQSAANLIAGLRNVGKINQYKTKNLVKLKGEPNERIQKEKKLEKLIYKTSDVKLSDNKTADHEATYVFYKKKLVRFNLKIDLNDSKLAKN